MSFALTATAFALWLRALNGTPSRSEKRLCASTRRSPFSILAMSVVKWSGPDGEDLRAHLEQRLARLIGHGNVELGLDDLDLVHVARRRPAAATGHGQGEDGQ